MTSLLRQDFYFVAEGINLAEHGAQTRLGVSEEPNKPIEKDKKSRARRGGKIVYYRVLLHCISFLVKLRTALLEKLKRLV